MFGILVGWGVFWLLLWMSVIVLGVAAKEDNWIGSGLLFTAISCFYLVAVFVGRMVM